MEQDVFLISGGARATKLLLGRLVLYPAAGPQSSTYPLPVESPHAWDSLCSQVPTSSFLQLSARHMVVLGSPASLLGPTSRADYGV